MMQVMEPGGHPPGSGGWARPCDACRSTACSVYCRFEALYLCGGCDRQAHAAELLVSSSSRHERVWVCEACGRAPATVTCKADAAALCTACDADVHDANPLTRRHQRLPIVPIEGIGGGEGGAAGACWRSGGLFGDEEEDGYRSGGGGGGNNNGYNGLFGGEVDEYLDLAGFNSCADEQNNLEQHHQQQHQQPHHEQMQQQQHREYEAPEFSSVTSLNHSVSVSSMDASVVPDGSSGGQPDTYTSRGTPLDLFVYPHQAAQVLPQYMAAAATTTLQPQFNHPVMDREARVMRYREKRKNRKFEKTIRYASRKAYAETRPRIKGRFAKRTTDVEVEVDQLFSQGVMAGGDHNGGYGVVPTY